MASSNPQQQQSSFMSTNPSPLVWFLLLDSATGHPCKGTTSDYVSVSASADVVDFRDAVKAKHSSKLSSVNAANLLVYKNKTAFVEGREDPLEEDSLITGFGASKKEALLVVVPSSAENSSGKFTAIPDIILALRELNQTNLVILEELRENNKFLRKTIKKDFTLKKPESYRSDNIDMRLQWLIHYGMIPPTSTALPQDAFCHLLGAQVPLKYLNFSHLFQMSWLLYARDFFGLPNINTCENILILLKIFEEAFESGRFVLLVDKPTGLIRCKIIDKQLKNKKLDEAMKDVFPNYQVGDVNFQGKICFGDFDGQELHFLNAKRPFTRCLSFHALVTREHAFGYGWIDSNDLKELDDEDMWSDGYLDEKTRKFIANCLLVKLK